MIASTLSFWAVWSLVSLLIVWGALRVWSQQGDVFTASFVTILYMALLYSADPIWSWAAGTYGFSARLRYGFSQGDLPDGTSTVALAGLAIASFLWGRTVRAGDALLVWVDHRFRPVLDRRFDERRAVAVLLLALTATVLALVQAFRTRLNTVFDLVRWSGNKQAIFEGQGYLLLPIAAFKAAVLLYTAHRLVQSASRRSLLGTVIWASAILATALVDVAVGSRSSLMFGNLLVLLVLVHRGSRRITVSRAILLWAPLGLALILGVRVMTRDVFVGGVQSQRPPMEIVRDQLSALGENIFFIEAQAFDSQMHVAMRHAGREQPLWGETLISLATLPIPRAIFPEKPRGGNVAFTSRYYPVRYETTRVEFVVSFLTEMWMNFRGLGVIAGFGVLGTLVGMIDRHAPTRRHPLLDCVYALLVWRFIGLIRGDAYTWVVGTVVIGVPLLVAYWLMTSRAETQSAHDIPARVVLTPDHAT